MTGAIIWITGKDGGRNSAVLERLRAELAERGGRVEVLHGDLEENLGVHEDLDRKIHACSMLARNGVTVLVSSSSLPDHEEEGVTCMEVEASSIEDAEGMHEFIRRLELGGLVPPPSHDVHPDEEEEIRKRLAQLGYLDED
jgi:hypothetical protein